MFDAAAFLMPTNKPFIKNNPPRTSSPRRRPPAMAATKPHLINYGPTPTILLTNDDGIHPESALLLPLAEMLVGCGYDVVVCAPGKNNSACGHAITLGNRLTMRRHPAYERRFASTSSLPKRPALHVFSIDEGTPADCVVAAIQPRHGLLARLNRWPRLTVSALNFGQNLGSDVIYSGTFAAARQSAMYGIPALASSIDLFQYDQDNHVHVTGCQRALRATVDIVNAALHTLPEQPSDVGRLHPSIEDNSTANDKRADDILRQAFTRGDVVLNINIPCEWMGEYQTTRLDGLFYRDPISLDYVPTGIEGDEEETLDLQLQNTPPDSMYSHWSDTKAVLVNKVASVTPVSSWPQSHPLALPDTIFEAGIRQGISWLPTTSKLSVAKPV